MALFTGFASDPSDADPQAITSLPAPVVVQPPIMISGRRVVPRTTAGSSAAATPAPEPVSAAPPEPVVDPLAALASLRQPAPMAQPMTAAATAPVAPVIPGLDDPTAPSVKLVPTIPGLDEPSSSSLLVPMAGSAAAPSIAPSVPPGVAGSPEQNGLPVAPPVATPQSAPGSALPASSGETAQPSPTSQAAASPPAVPAITPTAHDQPKAVQPFTGQDAPYKVDETGGLSFDPRRLSDGLLAANKAGLVDDASLKKLLPHAMKAEDAAKAQQDTVSEMQAKEASAGNYAPVKAAAFGAAKAGGFLAASAPGAATGAEIGAFGGPVGVAAGAIIGGLITGTLGSMAVDKTTRLLAQHSDTIKSFTDASDLHPYYDAAGNLLAFGAGLPKVASRGLAAGADAIAGSLTGKTLAAAGTVSGAADGFASTAARIARGTAAHYENSGSLLDTIKNLSEENALNQKAGATALNAGLTTAGHVALGAGFNVALDTGLKVAAKALGWSDQGQTFAGIVQSAVQGAITSGHIGFQDYSNSQVQNIAARGLFRDNADIDLGKGDLHAGNIPGSDRMDAQTVSQFIAPLTAHEQEIYNAVKAAITQARSSGQPVDSSTASITARQATRAGKPYGVTSVDVASEGTPRPAANPAAPSPEAPRLPGPSPETPLTEKPAAPPTAASDDGDEIPGLEGSTPREDLIAERDGKLAALQKGKLPPAVADSLRGDIGQLNAQISASQLREQASPSATPPDAPAPPAPAESPRGADGADGAVPSETAVVLPPATEQSGGSTPSSTELNSNSSAKPAADDPPRALTQTRDGFQKLLDQGKIAPEARESTQAQVDALTRQIEARRVHQADESPGTVQSEQPPSIPPAPPASPETSAGTAPEVPESLAESKTTGASAVSESPRAQSSTRTTFDKVVGDKLDAKRTAFHPDSGTLGIPREQMPQVAAEHRGAMANFLNARGMKVSEADVLPGDLKPSQAEFNPGKVAKARAIREAGDASPRRILHSNDGHVIDGHHQWLDRLQHAPDQPMPALGIDAPAKDILAQIHEFPSAGMEKAPDVADAPARIEVPRQEGDTDKAAAARAWVADERAAGRQPNTVDVVRKHQIPPTKAGDILAAQDAAEKAALPATPAAPAIIPGLPESAETVSPSPAPAPAQAFRKNQEITYKGRRGTIHEIDDTHAVVRLKAGPSPKNPNVNLLAIRSRIPLDSLQKYGKPVEKAPAPTPAPVTGPITPQQANDIAQRGVAANLGLFGRLGMTPEFGPTPDSNRSGLMFTPGKVVVDTQKLVDTLQRIRRDQEAEGLASTPEDWFVEALAEEGFHGGQAAIAEEDGMSLPEHVRANLTDEVLGDGWREAGREAYGPDQWDALRDWQQRAEYARMAGTTRIKGTFTEALRKYLARVLEHFRGVAQGKGVDPRLTAYLDRVIARVREAGDAPRPEPEIPGLPIEGAKPTAEPAPIRSPRSFKMPTAPTGNADALDHIVEQGGMVSPAKAKASGRVDRFSGDYDGAPTLGGFYHHAVFGGKMMPDRMAAVLHENYGVGDGSVDGMWNAISQAKDLRAKVRAEQQSHAALEKQANRFDKDALQPDTAKGETKINTGTLSVGDKVQIGDQTLTVTGIDPDTLDVELEDHSKYGVQQVADNTALYVEKVEPAAVEDRAAAASSPPQLRPGEKGTGDMFQGEDQPFNLAGETAIDHGARQTEQERVEREAAEAKAKQEREQQPLFASSPDDAEAPSRVFARWSKIAEDPASFRHTTTDAKDPQAVAENYSRPGQEIKAKTTLNVVKFSSPRGALEVRLRAKLSPEGERSLARPTPAYISSENAGSQGRVAGGGDQLYQAAMTWAHNNGVRIEGDPHGLSPIARLRRTSQMLSSALRHGTTDHLLPAGPQKIEGWKPGDFEGNVAALARKERDLVFRAVPELKTLRFDPATDSIRDAQGQAVSQDHLVEIIRRKDPSFASGVGPSTASRALITESALRPADRGGIQDATHAAGGEAGDPVSRDVLYASGPGAGADGPHASTVWEDAKTGLKNAVGVFRGAMEDVQKLVAAHTVAGAEEPARILQEMAAKTDRAKALMEHEVRGLHDLVAKLPASERKNFRDALEDNATLTDPAQQSAADELRRFDTERVTALQERFKELGIDELGNFTHFYKYLVPHLFEKPDVAAGVIQRRIEKGKGFLKHRVIPTWKDIEELQRELRADGRHDEANALNPASDNPVEMMLARWSQQESYVAAQFALKEATAVSAGQWRPTDYEPRLGEVRVDPRIGTRLTPHQKEHFYMPEAGARIFNNYLSPGLRDKDWFQAYLGAANSVNMFQLGFSAFHLGFTSVDTMTSKLALALNQVASGQPMNALKSLAEVPLSPIITAMRGDKLVKEWHLPGSQGPEVGAVLNAIISGGGAAGVDPFYVNQAWKSMMQDFHSGELAKYARGALKAPFALTEQMMKPLMEYIVPRQKMGVAADLIRFEMAKNPGMTHQELREIADKVVRSTDNRLGQLRYANLHWHKVLKDLAMASMRSVGWNIGTMRELGGGLKDWARFAADGTRRAAGNADAKPDFTYRMAYTLAMPLLTGMMGALVYLLRGQTPQTLKDYFYPETGETDEQGRAKRIAFPSYMKDVVAYGNAPLTTIGHKLHPLLSMMADMIKNEDFYGVKIRNEDDPLIKQITSELGYVGQQFEPFALRGAKQAGADASFASKALPFIGITPAPASITNTKALNMANQFLANRAPSGARTSEEAAKSDLKKQIVDALRKGDKAPFRDALAKGSISKMDAGRLLARAQMTPLQYKVSLLHADEAQKVLAVATSQERAQIERLVSAKAQRASALGPPAKSMVQSGAVASAPKPAPKLFAGFN